MRLLTAILAAALLPAAVPSQSANLLSNADFEASRGSIAPWTTDGFARFPMVDDFATNGAVKSRTYGFTLGGGDVHNLRQAVALAAVSTPV